MVIIDSISLYLIRTGSPTGLAYLSVYHADENGFPTGDAIATSSVEASSISTSADWKNFTLSQAVEAAGRIVFVLSVPGSEPTGGNTIYWYAVGSGGSSTLGCGSTDGGSTWFNSSTGAYRLISEGSVIETTTPSILPFSTGGISLHGTSFFIFNEAPYNPFPSDLATDIDIADLQLQWECDGEPDHYEVWFGTGLGGPTLRGTTTDKFWDVPFTLSVGLEYEWKIVAVYGEEELDSDEWSFTTKPLSFYLSKPVNPTPTHEQSDVPIGTTSLAWENGGGATSYDVYVREGESGDLVKVASDVTGLSYAISGLKYSTSYYWRVDAKNQFGTVQGDVWEFAIHSLELSGQVANVIKRRLIAAAKDRIWYEEI